METYDVYEIYYTGKMSEYNDVLNEDEAHRMWNGKWSNMAETKINEYDNDFFSATAYVFERTIRNEGGEPIDSYDIDGSVFLLED